jgi:hypothetical protein
VQVVRLAAISGHLSFWSLQYRTGQHVISFAGDLVSRYAGAG